MTEKVTHSTTRYSITKEERAERFAKQKGKCLLCPRLATDLDHNHATGTVRGFLCHGCNTMLGNVREDPRWLADLARRNPLKARRYESAILYLEIFGRDRRLAS